MRYIYLRIPLGYTFFKIIRNPLFNIQPEDKLYSFHFSHPLFSVKKMAVEKWPQETWQKLNVVGGSGGKEVQLIGRGGTFVKKIRVYKNKVASTKSLRGIDVTFTDDENEKAGALNEDGIDFFFEPGEKVKAMTLWGNGKGTRTGRIWLETSKGRTFDYGMNTKGQNSYATDVGSGLLIGFMGRFDAEINCLAAVSLKPIETLYVDNIKYPNLDLADTSSLTLRTLATAEPQWNGRPYVFRFTGNESDQTTTTFNNKMGFEMGVEVTYKAGVPLIGGGGNQGRSQDGL